MATPNLAELSRSDRETLEAWLVDFDQSWDTGAFAVWAAEKLPGPKNPLRRLALAEMVKVDLERQWQQGRQVTLGSYLERFPELGRAETISADLIFAEYRVRQQFGAPAELREYSKRFPGQAHDLARLIQKYAAEHSVPPLTFEQRPGVAE